MVNSSEASPVVRGRYQPKPRWRHRSGQAGWRASGGVFTLMERDVADFPQTLQIATQRPHIGPADLVRGAVEVLGAEGCEAGQDRVDFGLAGNEGCNSG